MWRVDRSFFCRWMAFAVYHWLKSMYWRYEILKLLGLTSKKPFTKVSTKEEAETNNPTANLNGQPGQHYWENLSFRLKEARLIWEKNPSWFSWCGFLFYLQPWYQIYLPFGLLETTLRFFDCSIKEFLLIKQCTFCLTVQLIYHQVIINFINKLI
jgi:hypothetical protein